jgi:hypothetical protein
LSLSACRFDLVDFKLDKVCDCNDHLGHYGLAVEHLEEVGKVGQWARLRVKRLEVEGRVTDDGSVENGARDCGGIG